MSCFCFFWENFDKLSAAFELVFFEYFHTNALKLEDLGQSFTVFKLKHLINNKTSPFTAAVLSALMDGQLSFLSITPPTLFPDHGFRKIIHLCGAKMKNKNSPL